MQADRGAIGAGALALVLLLAGCGGSKEPNLMNVRANTNGPDEFAILPPKPLEMPENLSALPTPTPGGSNRTDPTPEADAIVALGGNPTAGGNDAALVAHATRHGVDPGIRGELAAADLEYRRKNDGRLLEKLFNVNVYYRAYKPQSLDQHAELEYWRRRMAGNPSAPPKGVEKDR
ncbi:DUF3035 domain-containing protein [Gemmobacter denitrificans]|uniref:DUF3035 domain-containing protein n=1 Tax=Gemmobacter denitrificans TaxID=3123040 RepID=A0ABU8C000_9RHOB